VAFFTQLSDVFLDDEGIFFVVSCAGVVVPACQLAARILKF